MPVRIIFVCYENICRSPMAEGAFSHLADLRGVGRHFEVGSAGTVCYQAGSPPNPRAVRAAARSGVDISGIRARCIHDLDISSFDHIFVMDHGNWQDVAGALEGGIGPRVHLVAEFAGSGVGMEIEDPYYGTESTFNSTFALLAGCVEGILDSLIALHGLVDSSTPGEVILQPKHERNHGSAG
ncbi:MAG: low molecular weight phosphotyrosine protein phosphatase [Chlorobiaceae bacterium]|nr:low molecular weight phosphotyrosine protein phosphatase [Chlorobiaceae bacterium]